MRTYKEILSDVVDSCYDVMYSCEDYYTEMIKAATKIYIAELQMDRSSSSVREVEYPMT